jgi:hypothetical protein
MRASVSILVLSVGLACLMVSCVARKEPGNDAERVVRVCASQAPAAPGDSVEDDYLPPLPARAPWWHRRVEPRLDAQMPAEGFRESVIHVFWNADDGSVVYSTDDRDITIRLPLSPDLAYRPERLRVRQDLYRTIDSIKGVFHDWLAGQRGLILLRCEYVGRPIGVYDEVPWGIERILYGALIGADHLPAFHDLEFFDDIRRDEALKANPRQPEPELTDDRLLPPPELPDRDDDAQPCAPPFRS